MGRLRPLARRLEFRCGAGRRNASEAARSPRPCRCRSRLGNSRRRYLVTGCGERACAGQGPGLVQNIAVFTRPGPPSDEWDDAEIAHEIAPVLDLEVGPLVVGEITDPADGEVPSINPLSDDYGLGILWSVDVVQDGQFFLVADDQVYPGDRGDGGGATLRIATDHGGKGVGIASGKGSDGLAAFGIGQIGYRAGIDDAQIGRFAKWDDTVSGCHQSLADDERFRLVEAATQGVKGGASGLSGNLDHG